MDIPKHTPASIRVALGLSQLEMAERARKSVGTIQKIERGGPVHGNTIHSIAPHYGLTPEQLVEAMERAKSVKAAS